MKAMFTIEGIQQYMENRVNNADQKIIEALQYIGENFVTKARNTGNYSNNTGNLRSSIGYVILKDGQIVDSNFPGDKAGGVSEGMKTAEDVAADYPQGFVLIGVAGMSYAAAVESRGFDVITGSAPEAKQVKDLLGAIKI